MKRFWDALIGPVLEAARPESIVEIGSDEGLNTRNLLAYAERTGAVVHVIDPVPKYDVAEWQQRYGPRFVFHRALSIDAIPSVDRMDLVLVDGDHNWYTVYNELRMIEERCAELSQPFPLVMLHDVGWPFGRRDLYYDPDTIPEEHRRPHGPEGIRPGVEGLLEEGGMIRDLEKASREGGPRNGVFTAVEDFLRETEQDLELIVVPGFHGLALLVPPGSRQNKGLAEILEIWNLPPNVARHAERLEGAWLETEAHRQDLHARNKRLVERNRAMEALRGRLGERDEEVARLRAELAERADGC
jgi:Methyltransferase domain